MALLNKHIVVTRAADQSASFTAKLQIAGALVLNFPLIDVIPYSESNCPVHPDEFDWLVVTSVNAVRHFGTCLRAADNSYADLRHCRAAAIGEATAQALREEGLEVHIIPETHVSGPLIEAILNSEPRPKGKRVLLPQGNLAKSGIAETLEAHGMCVTPVVCYTTVLRQPDLLEIQGLLDFFPDGITFFSPSAVEAFTHARLPEKTATEGIRLVYASIGPVTTKALRNAGLSPVIEAHRQREDGIIEALKTCFE